MRDLLERIEEAGSHIKVDWSPARADALRARMIRARARRARTRVVLAAAACLAVAVVAIAGWRLYPRGGELAADANPPSVGHVEGSVVLSDGTKAVPLDRSSEVRALRVTPERVVLELARGGARFTVTPSASRSVVVSAGEVTVEVLGTEFTVERMDERARVAVDRGNVRVSWSGGTHALGAGQSGEFPPSVAPPVGLDPDVVDAAAGTDAGARVQPPARPSSTASAPEASSWRALAEQGDHAEAYGALQKQGPDAVRDRPEDLMLAADVARLSGHPGESVAYLRGVVSRHGGDPRAPLAAFTLGRVLLDELGRPAAASAAFADVQRLAPGGALAQDALAREIEALAKAGQTVAAHERALQYVERYPSGRRIKSVRRYGGLE